MTAPQIRSDYDQLQQIAQAFNAQADSVNKTTQQLKSCVDQLKSNDWVGKGATAFYREWDDSVFPTMKRLHNALSEAARVTNQISQVMKQAEDEASKCFHL